MSSQSKLKSYLKLSSNKRCAQYLKKHVRFDLSDIYRQLELLERNEKRSKCASIRTLENQLSNSATGRNKAGDSIFGEEIQNLLILQGWSPKIVRAPFRLEKAWST